MGSLVEFGDHLSSIAIGSMGLLTDENHHPLASYLASSTFLRLCVVWVLEQFGFRQDNQDLKDLQLLKGELSGSQVVGWQLALYGWSILVGYPQPRLHGIAVTNSASIPKLECHFRVPDWAGGGIPPTGEVTRIWAGSWAGFQVRWAVPHLKDMVSCRCFNKSLPLENRSILA